MAQVNESLSSPAKTTPKDIQVMASILKELDVKDYEPRLLNQMLEFTHRYIGSILDDAQLYSAHAKKKTIDSSDIQLAINLQQDRNFTSAPDKDIISDMARQRNNTSLPLIKTSSGLRLPSDRYSLTSCNYHLKSISKKQSRVNHTVSRLNMNPSSVSKGLPSLACLNKGSPSPLMPKTSSIVQNTMMSKTVSNIVKPVTTAILKFPDGKTMVSTTPPPFSTLTPTSSHPVSQSSLSHILMPTMGVMNTELKLPNETASVKRKHEEDDDYDLDE